MRHPMRYLVAVLTVFMGLAMGHDSFAEPAGTLSANSADDWSVVGFGNPLASADLENQSGQKDIQIDDIDIHVIDTDVTGYLGQNYLALDGSTNGANTISGTAFSGASGIATVIQNSGNQVLIQNATIVDVTMK